MKRFILAFALLSVILVSCKKDDTLIQTLCGKRWYITGETTNGVYHSSSPYCGKTISYLLFTEPNTLFVQDCDHPYEVKFNKLGKVMNSSNDKGSFAMTITAISETILEIDAISVMNDPIMGTIESHIMLTSILPPK